MRRTRLALLKLTLLISLVPVLISPCLEAASGEDWPQFRGQHRDGMSLETGLLDEWPEAGPQEVWRVALGEGYSGIAVVGDRIYTMYAGEKPSEEENAIEYAAAFEAATGKELWRTAIGPKYDTEFGNGPRSTPSVDGDTVYVLGSVGDFAALSIEDGSEKWRLDLKETFSAETPDWGYSTSPMIEGDLILVQGGGGEGKGHAALDKKTGEVKWTVGEGNGYNSPVAITMNGQRRFIYIASSKLVAIDGEGEEVWSYDWPDGETHATPIFLPPDRIYASGAEGVGAALLQVDDNGDGEAQVKEVWKTNLMRNHFNQAIVHEGHIYGFDNANLKCINTEDASMAWRKRGLGKGSLIFAEGRLYVLSDKGKIVMLQATPDGYVEKGSVQALQGRSWTPPTLSMGRLYVRNHTEMVAYEIRR